MTDKKLTDLEIVKALECCVKSSHFGECFENKCPLVSENGCKVGKETLYPYALDLINRLQEENERLKDHIQEGVELAKELPKMITLVKAEAYKECAEKIDTTTWYHINKNGELVKGANSETDIPLFKAEDIFNLLKELVGDSQ